jgi:hypothetical protein
LLRICFTDFEWIATPCPARSIQAPGHRVRKVHAWLPKAAHHKAGHHQRHLHKRLPPGREFFVRQCRPEADSRSWNRPPRSSRLRKCHRSPVVSRVDTTTPSIASARLRHPAQLTRLPGRRSATGRGIHARHEAHAVCRA